MRPATFGEPPAPGRAPAPPPAHRRAPRRPACRVEPERGFSLLPEPNPGDIWLDFEGHPWFEPARGLEYLFGWVELDDDGRAALPLPLGARPRRGEDRLRAARRHDRRAPPPLPGHARLPLRAVRAHRAHAPDGRARDARGRARRPPPRRGARRPLPRDAAGAPRLASPATRSRTSRSSTGSSARPRSRGGSESVVAFEKWLEIGEDSLLEGIRAYNEEDCVSLYELHRWLLELRPPDLAWRPPPEEREAERGGEEQLEERERVRAELLAARRRASRAGYSRSFSSTTAARRGRSGGSTSTTARSTRRSCSRTATRSAASSSSASRCRSSSRSSTLPFPPQEHKIGGEAVDPATEKRYSVAVDDEQGTVDAPARHEAADEPLPRALIPPQPLPTGCSATPCFASPRTRPLSGARRDSRAAAPAGAARRDARRSCAQPRRELPLRAGAARLGEDVERRADGGRAHEGGPARRHHGAQPQGDPQVPRGRRGRGARGRATRSAG